MAKLPEVVSIDEKIAKHRRSTGSEWQLRHVLRNWTARKDACSLLSSQLDPFGRCNVSVTAAGFETKHVNDVNLQVGELRTVDLRLGAGTVEQTVVVEASTVTLDQDSAATGGVIARQQVENLPINGRNWRV